MLKHLSSIRRISIPITCKLKQVQNRHHVIHTQQLLNLTRKHFVTNSFWRKIVDVINEAKRTIQNQEQRPRVRTPSELLKIIRGEVASDYKRYQNDNSDVMDKTPQELFEEHQYKKELHDFIEAKVKSANLIQAKRLVDRDELEQATECLDLILQYDPKNADAYVVKAFVAAKKFKNQEALGYLDTALELNPTHRTALLGKGTIYLHLKEYELALKYLDMVLEKYPVHVPALINKAAVLSRLGRDEQALRIYDTILQLDPQNSIAIESRARLFSKRKKELELEQKKDLEQLKLKSNLRREKLNPKQ